MLDILRMHPGRSVPTFAVAIVRVSASFAHPLLGLLRAFRLLRDPRDVRGRDHAKWHEFESPMGASSCRPSALALGPPAAAIRIGQASHRGARIGAAELTGLLALAPVIAAQPLARN